MAAWANVKVKIGNNVVDAIWRPNGSADKPPKVGEMAIVSVNLYGDWRDRNEMVVEVGPVEMAW